MILIFVVGPSFRWLKKAYLLLLLWSTAVHLLLYGTSAYLQTKLGVCQLPHSVSFAFAIYFSLLKAHHLK